jgi:hypothetical protein
MAALGVGLAGNALAAPVADQPAPTPDATSALPALPALPTGKPLAMLTDAAQGKGLPTLFVFQAPKVNTSGPSGVDRIPTAGAPVRTQTTAVTSPATVSPETGSDDLPPAESPRRVGALAALDSTGMFGDMLAKPLVDQHGLGTGGLALS